MTDNQKKRLALYKQIEETLRSNKFKCEGDEKHDTMLFMTSIVDQENVAGQIALNGSDEGFNELFINMLSEEDRLPEGLIQAMMMGICAHLIKKEDMDAQVLAYLMTKYIDNSPPVDPSKVCQCDACVQARAEKNKNNVNIN